MSWRGTPLPGGRTHALLAALVAGERSGVSEDALIEGVWEDDVPANPSKALQVVVSRVRSQTGPDVVVRTERGYRLGLDSEAVDALALTDLVDAARRAEGHGDRVGARGLAREALAHHVRAGDGSGPLADVRARAVRDLGVASAVLGRALSVLGDHDEALPLLESASRDDVTLAALLRSEAAVRGVPAALERYERLRADLADRLGVDPAPALRAVHAELLAADHPVREGVRFDATSLVGRADDVRVLRALVREARAVSILGPGGLGKTRLAHVLAREADQQVVHFVELVSVVDPDDVVGEVGSALGVRDSVSSRRVLTAEQLRDVRARVAQALETAPTLLVLDNCEQVIGAVADLVAFLVATVPSLRVVTTTRAPLGIAAERVFALGQLDEDAATELFGQRAMAVRPDVALPDSDVRRVVNRLDGLPLAIELAAAKVRVMSVADLDRRLVDRFALLRGGDRTKPDRHQTLLAVIDWSWNLLAESERDALQRLSVFADGFTLEAADALLGHDALDEVTSLVDQSLLTVVEDPHDPVSVRYRMLQTVREFGRMQLVGAGRDAEAETAVLAWATDLGAAQQRRLWSVDQVDAVASVKREESNLADCLRRALLLPDRPAVCVLVAALGAYWTITGQNSRVFTLAGAVDDVLRGWEPPADQRETAVAAASMVALNTVTGGDFDHAPACLALLETYGGDTSDPLVRGMVEVLAAQDPGDLAGTLDRLAVLGEGPDRHAATQALMWSAHYRENLGDAHGAIEAAERGLARCTPQDGPWLAALLRVLIGTIYATLGRHTESEPYLRSAIPDLDQLGDHDDAIQGRAMLAMGAMHTGRLDEAAAILDELERREPQTGGLGGPLAIAATRAELTLAQGRVDEGLAQYREAIALLRELSFPAMGFEPGLEPWTLFGEGAALTAHALHAEGSSGEDLFELLRDKAPHVLDSRREFLDYPVAGVVLHALGVWGLLRAATDAETSVRLLALADRFAYTRYSPTMDPKWTATEAERVLPGALERITAGLGERRGPDLLEEARAAVALL